MICFQLWCVHLLFSLLYQRFTSSSSFFCAESLRHFFCLQQSSIFIWRFPFIFTSSISDGVLIQRLIVGFMIVNRGALLMTGEHGNIALLDPSGNVTWSSDHTQVLRPNVLLLDIGNLVNKEGTENSQTFFWQSFDYPTHILLPDMKLGWKLNTGLNRYLTSWKSSEDPSTGDF
ncbi:unnamed protein product, partial [Prunus brigantina]